jgi:hypothetical protein
MPVERSAPHPVIPQSRPADSSAICFIAGAKLIPDTSLRAFWDDTLGLSR